MKQLVFLIAATAFAYSTASADYDLFSGAQYPGGIKRPGVDLYQVKQKGGRYAEGYQRRTVTWWPRKGVDIIEVKKGMPLRTWTLRDRQIDANVASEHPEPGTEALTRRLQSTQARTFKAHLIGFRGLGNEYGNSFGYPDYYCPAVVLRLPDGRKRCFTRTSFVEEDEKVILELYMKEMKRIRTTLADVEYRVSEHALREWPNNAKPGEPGTMRFESDHIVWVSGSQQAPNESYSPWVNRTEPEKAALYREGTLALGEYMWAYLEHAGLIMPGLGADKPTKYLVKVCGTYMNGHQWIKGYAGGGAGACELKHALGGPWSGGLMHEWGHGLRPQPRGQNGEVFADAVSVINDPAKMAFKNNVQRPYRHTFHAAYPSGLFYAMMGDDPNWGYCMVAALPAGKGEESYFHTLARIGEQRGLFPNGVRGAGDMMGEFAARLAEFDCEFQDNLRRAFTCVRRNALQAVDRKAGLYRIPWSESPEAFGSNVIRLVPDKGAKKIAIDFRGFCDPTTYGDWRACIVAVDADGKPRYSPLWNKGVMEMKIRQGDRRFWLTVAATPWALFDEAPLYIGRHAPRYPYEVKLAGCRPGTPHSLPGDTDDYELTHVGLGRNWHPEDLCKLPYPGDTPEADIMRKTIPLLRKKLNTFTTDLDRLIEEGKIDTEHWWFKWQLMRTLNNMKPYVDRAMADMTGGRHPNGGGWVATSAEVAPTAYVGPDAMVLDGARVLDHAALEDYAVVRGSNVIVSGHARISGQACVAGNARIGGYTRVTEPINAGGRKTITPHDVTLRPYQDPAICGKLWANYAMDRGESELFEDWFRYRDNRDVQYKFFVLNLNGHLYGQPTFAVDGERRGFRFDGRTQYAEASPILADLGEITVEVGLKWAGGKDQAVFDFGTSEDNCFVLSPAGASGKPELMVTVDGKTDRVVADAPLPPNTWVDCRVEIDGETIALWIDGRRAAQQKSAFRATHAYPPGREKRNFVAAARGARRHFKGTVDYLRVWHTVYDDFAKAPPPLRHAPRRVDRSFIETCKIEYGGAADASKLRDALIQQAMDKLPMGLGFYDEIGKKTVEMVKAIEDQPSPARTQAEEDLAKCKEALDQRTKELQAVFAKLPETIEQTAKHKEHQDKVRKWESARNTKQRELQDTCRADNKDFFDEQKAVVAQARQETKKADVEVRRIEQSFEAMPEIAALKTPAQRDVKIAKLKTTSEPYAAARNAAMQAREKVRQADAAMRKKLDAAIKDVEELDRLNAEMWAARTLARTFSPNSRPYIEDHTEELSAKVRMAERKLADFVKRYIAARAPEHNWLHNMDWTLNNRHYNHLYKDYIKNEVVKDLGITIRLCDEDFKGLESILEKQTEAKWHTRCDWEWRMKQEVDGSIEKNAAMQQWVKRARGD
ncbi:MAG: hypothetical protein HN383_17720 [Verrucomicrobia bacterium]|nr:hypothetical protein [Verrucomicrobiota bacterium]